ncbi:hypothetical protein AB0D27_35690 [Streptomyces sp. NPDC048415]|jgi:hypothetical protein|uniref:hypothetical protein n=1 Tax=Streptomyces sp. NPDC048415 TaxID=3154822 RepID=UPI003414DFDE
MHYAQGDRVEYKGQDNQKHTGQIQRVRGQEPNLKYTVRDEQTQTEEQIQETQIDRTL